MKNIKSYWIKVIGIIPKAFDAFYNFLDLVMRIGMAACILALKLIIHLLRPVIVKTIEWLRALFVRHPKYRAIVVFNHVRRVRRLEDEECQAMLNYLRLDNNFQILNNYDIY